MPYLECAPALRNIAICSLSSLYRGREATFGIQLDKDKPFPPKGITVIQLLYTDVQCHLKYALELPDACPEQHRSCVDAVLFKTISIMVDAHVLEDELISNERKPLQKHLCVRPH